MIEWMKKNRKELLLPFLCFVLGVLLAIASIQVQEQGTDTKEDQTLAHFQPKDYQNLVSKEQEIKQFKWTIEAVANLKVRLKQTWIRHRVTITHCLRITSPINSLI